MIGREPPCRDVTVYRDDIVLAANVIASKRTNMFDQRNSNGKIAALCRKPLNRERRHSENEVAPV